MLEEFILTKSAANRVKTLIDEEKNTNLKLRIFIKGGGCSGFKYGFILDETINSDDIIIKKYNVKLLIDSISYQYLIGAEIDYRDEVSRGEFVINNPNAVITCGCGSSFSI